MHRHAMPIDLKPRTAGINGRLWGARARDWADIQEGMVRPVYDAVLERTRVTAGTRYLDVGCGAGMAAQMAAARGAQVSGIDSAEALLDIAHRRTPAGDFRRADLEELPFGDRSFDVVAGFNAFQYAGNRAVALAEARRVTRPGGAVVIVTWGNPDGMEAASLVAVLRPLRCPMKRPCAISPPAPASRRSRSSMSTARSSTRTKPRRSGVSTPPASRP
jgi:SAM-dependent methyltransferase